MKDTRKGVLGGKGFKTTTDISKAQTCRTTRKIVENVARSGAGTSRKGDKVVLETLLFEEKTTTRGSIRLSRTVIEKICKEALEAGAKIPCMLASFESALPSHVYKDWVIMPLEHCPLEIIAGGKHD